MGRCDGTIQNDRGEVLRRAAEIVAAHKRRTVDAEDAFLAVDVEGGAAVEPRVVDRDVDRFGDSGDIDAIEESFDAGVVPQGDVHLAARRADGDAARIIVAVGHARGEIFDFIGRVFAVSDRRLRRACLRVVERDVGRVARRTGVDDADGTAVGTQCDDFGVRKGYVGICSVQAVYGIGFRCVADEFHAVERQFDVIAGDHYGVLLFGRYDQVGDRHAGFDADLLGRRPSAEIERSGRFLDQDMVAAGVGERAFDLILGVDAADDLARPFIDDLPDGSVDLDVSFFDGQRLDDRIFGYDQRVFGRGGFDGRIGAFERNGQVGRVDDQRSRGLHLHRERLGKLLVRSRLLRDRQVGRNGLFDLDRRGGSVSERIGNFEGRRCRQVGRGSDCHSRRSLRQRFVGFLDRSDGNRIGERFDRYELVGACRER